MSVSLSPSLSLSVSMCLCLFASPSVSSKSGLSLSIHGTTAQTPSFLLLCLPLSIFLPLSLSLPLSHYLHPILVKSPCISSYFIPTSLVPFRLFFYLLHPVIRPLSPVRPRHHRLLRTDRPASFVSKALALAAATCRA